MSKLRSGRTIGAAALAGAVAAMVAFAVPSQAAPKASVEQKKQGQGSEAVLAVSGKSDRSNSVALAGETLSGTKWIHVQNAGDATKAVYFVDQPDLAEVHRLEHTNPFDLMGTKADGNANGFDTTTLENGEHRIAAVLIGKGEKASVVSATFSVRNVVAGTEPGNGGVTPSTQPPPAPKPPVTTPPATTPPTTKPPVTPGPAKGVIPVNVSLTGAAEIPGPGDSDGSGLVNGEIDIAGDTFCYALSVKGLDTVTAAHIHRGAVDKDGPVVAELLIPAAGSVSGAIDACSSIPSDVVDRIAANPGNYYINVHTTAFPKGAVRGQL